MPYTQKQVERGRKLVASLTKNKWDLGDLALEVVPATVSLSSLDYQKSPERTQLEEFADAIDLSFKSLLTYRRVALAFPRASRRLDVSFTVHEDFSSIDNPVKVLNQRKMWTTQTAREYLDRAPKHNPKRPPGSPITAGQGPVSPRSSREKVADARAAILDLSEDEKVDLVRDKTTRHAVDIAGLAVSKEHDQQRRLNQTPLQARLDEAQNWSDISQHGFNASSELHKMLRKLGEFKTALDKGQIEDLEMHLEHARTACDWIETYKRTGGSGSFESELARLLEETP